MNSYKKIELITPDAELKSEILCLDFKKITIKKVGCNACFWAKNQIAPVPLLIDVRKYKQCFRKWQNKVHVLLTLDISTFYDRYPSPFDRDRLRSIGRIPTEPIDKLCRQWEKRKSTKTITDALAPHASPLVLFPTFALHVVLLSSIIIIIIIVRCYSSGDRHSDTRENPEARTNDFNH